MKERLVRAALVGAISVAGCAPEPRGVFCPEYNQSVATDTPRITFPPPSEVVFSKEREELLYQNWRFDFEQVVPPFSTESIKSQAATYVKNQLRDLCGSNLSNWEERVDQLVGVVRFLQPYEFSVRNMYLDGQRITELLALYEQDEKQAIIQLVEEQFYGYGPEGGALFIDSLYSAGVYLYETEEIFMNLNAVKLGVDEQEFKARLIHEIWHGLPGTRTWQDPLGNWYRVKGLVLDRWHEGLEAWFSAELSSRFRFSPPQIDHSLVYLLDPAEEVIRPTPTPAFEGIGALFENPIEAIPFVDRAFEVLGRERVIQLYLESAPDEFYRLAFENCEAFSEFLQEGSSCP